MKTACVQGIVREASVNQRREQAARFVRDDALFVASRLSAAAPCAGGPVDAVRESRTRACDGARVGDVVGRAGERVSFTLRCAGGAE